MANGVFYQELCQFGEPSHYEEMKCNEWMNTCTFVSKMKIFARRKNPVLNDILLCTVCKSEKLLWNILVKYLRSLSKNHILGKEILNQIWW